MDADSPALRPRGSSEFDAIKAWLALLPSSSPDLLVGPGDDAAWLKLDAPLAISVDRMEEGIHFERSWCTPHELGWKALAAALSDLAATRARPIGFLVTLSLGPEDRLDRSWADGAIAGMAHAAAELQAGPALGGDTVASCAGLGLGITVLGTGIDGLPPLLRSGAAIGDRIQLSGDCGWAGLWVARMRANEDSENPVPARARNAWCRPRPRLDLLPALTTATAGIDISDGLVADAAHLATASQVRLVLDRTACVPALLREAAGDGQAEHLALGGGEDYELLVTAPDPIQGFIEIGRVEEGSGLAWADGGSLDPAQWPGWDHGSAP